MNKTSIIYCDFKLKKTTSTRYIQESSTMSPLGDFKPRPALGNFLHLNSQEIFEHSEFLIKNFKDLSKEDVLYFIEQGVLDFNKAEKKLKERFSV